MTNKIMTAWPKKKFDAYLKKRQTEDLEVIKTIDNFFLKRRGYVFKQPKAKESVILLLSGGIDSTVAWATLIELYDYKVYPVIIDRGSKRRARRELAAVKYLEKYFAKKYPENYIPPFHLTVNTIAREFSDTINPDFVTDQEILHNFQQNKWLANDGSNVILVRTRGVSPYLMPFYGVVYSHYLKFTKNIEIKNIFVGANFTDGSEVSSQSFTALRSTLFAICTATADYSWNFSSVFLEREAGVLLEKGGTIALGAKLGVPLEKTWSCYGDGFFQCGDRCATCVNRREGFDSVDVEDKTIYWSSLREKVSGYLKFHLSKLKFW